MIGRFRERAQAVRSRPLPPVAGPEKKRFLERAQVDFMDFAMVGDATATLEAKGFHVVISTQTVPGSVDGQVAAQNPPANAVVAKGATVTLTQTAVPEPSPSPSTFDNPGQSLLCALLGAGCPATPTPTPGRRHGGGNN